MFESDPKRGEIGLGDLLRAIKRLEPRDQDVHRVAHSLGFTWHASQTEDHSGAQSIRRISND